MTDHQRAILAMYEPSTYCISLNPKEAKPLLDDGYLEWVPGPQWAGEFTYAITAKGRAALLPQ